MAAAWDERRILGMSCIAGRSFATATRSPSRWSAGSPPSMASPSVTSEPQFGLAAPILWQGSSWFTLILFLWIAWIAYRIAPFAVRPQWKLLVHIPGALLFSLTHVVGFVALRKLTYWLDGADYDFGAFFPNFLYEFSKDAFGYALFVATFALAEHLLRQLRESTRPRRRRPSTSATARS